MGKKLTEAQKLYRKQNLWIICQQDHEMLRSGYGVPVIWNDDDDVTSIIVFTNYEEAAKFCLADKALSFDGIPLLICLKKKDKYNLLFHALNAIKVDKIVVDPDSEDNATVFETDEFI